LLLAVPPIVVPQSFEMASQFFQQRANWPGLCRNLSRHPSLQDFAMAPHALTPRRPPSSALSAGAELASSTQQITGTVQIPDTNIDKRCPHRRSKCTSFGIENPY
jgi:hypothetical protein